MNFYFEYSLYLIQKAVGLAFEIHDTFNRIKKLAILDRKKDATDLASKKEAEVLRLELRFISLNPYPSALEIILYC